MSLVSAARGLKGAEPCPSTWRMAANSVNRKNSGKIKTTKTMKYAVRYFFPMSGSKVCALSSAQIERHSVTNSCPVALIGAIAGSTGKWSKQFKEMRNPQGTTPKVSSLWSHHYHRQMPAPTFLCSTPDFQVQLGLAPDPIKARSGVWWWPVSSPLVPHFRFSRDIASPGETCRAPHHKLGCRTAHNTTHRLLRATNRLCGRIKY